MVDHGIHVARGDPEKEPWLAQLSEITEVIPPVGLGDNCHPVTLILKNSSDDCCAERGVVYISITTKQNNIRLLPSEILNLFQRNGQPVGHAVFFRIMKVISLHDCLIVRAMSCRHSLGIEIREQGRIHKCLSRHLLQVLKPEAAKYSMAGGN